MTYPMCVGRIEYQATFQKIDGEIIEDQSSENLNWTVEINPVHLSDLIILIRKIAEGKGELEIYKKEQV